MKIIEHIKELRAKEKDAPTLVAISLSEEATKNAAYKAIGALLEVAEASIDYRSAVKQRDNDQAEWGAAGYTMSQDELMRRSDRMDAAIAKLREIKP